MKISTTEERQKQAQQIAESILDGRDEIIRLCPDHLRREVQSSLSAMLRRFEWQILQRLTQKAKEYLNIIEFTGEHDVYYYTLYRRLVREEVLPRDKYMALKSGLLACLSELGLKGWSLRQHYPSGEYIVSIKGDETNADVGWRRAHYYLKNLITSGRSKSLTLSEREGYSNYHDTTIDYHTKYDAGVMVSAPFVPFFARVTAMRTDRQNLTEEGWKWAEAGPGLPTSPSVYRMPQFWRWPEFNLRSCGDYEREDGDEVGPTFVAIYKALVTGAISQLDVAFDAIATALSGFLSVKLPTLTLRRTKYSWSRVIDNDRAVDVEAQLLGLMEHIAVAEEIDTGIYGMEGGWLIHLGRPAHYQISRPETRLRWRFVSEYVSHLIPLLTRNQTLTGAALYFIDRQEYGRTAEDEPLSTEASSASEGAATPCVTNTILSATFGAIRVTCDRGGRGEATYHNVQHGSNFFGWDVRNRRWTRNRVPSAELLNELETNGYSFWK